MHEFGHTLNLGHGGLDGINCKPNYLSIMSYSRQFDGSPIVGRSLDYSRAALATLDENNPSSKPPGIGLSEPAGIGGPAGVKTAYGPPPLLVVPADGPIDWNRLGGPVDVGAAADINNKGTKGCNGFGTLLQGFDDWANLLYDFRGSPDFADGVHATVLPDTPELTFEEKRCK